MPPPPVSTDFSRPWRREQSAAVLGRERLDELQRYEQITPSSDLDCDNFGNEMHWRGDPAMACSTFHDMDAFVDEVLRLNPTIQAAEQTWFAAMELYPQATALDDPAFRFMNGPTIFGSSQGQHLWRVQLAQRVPWYGKRGLHGEIADGQADVAYFDWQRTRQQLAAAARSAYLQYAVAEKLYELSAEDLRLAEALTSAPKIERVSTNAEALAAYDTYQIDRWELEQKREQSEAARELARERLNAMLQQDLSAPLPPPVMPQRPQEMPHEPTLIQQALMQSPELAAARRFEQQAAARVALAEKDFYPDIDVVGRFDTNASDFWAPDRANIRPQLGIYFPLKIQHNKRWAKLRQMKFEQRRRRAETVALQAKLTSDIQRSLTQLQRAQRQLASLDRMLAAAERRLESQVALVAHHPTPHNQTLVSERVVLKYRVEQIKHEAMWLDKLLELALLTGDAAADDQLAFPVHQPDVAE